MIYPSADKLNKIGSKYKLIAMASTRSKQLKAGMKPLIETTSTNPLTIAFEEIAAGVITANIDDIDEVSFDIDEFTRTSAVYEITPGDSDFGEEEIKGIDAFDSEVYKLSIDENENKSEIAESIKNEQTNLSDIRPQITETNIEEDRE